MQYVLITDVQELQRAVSAQQIASPHPYKKDYKEQVMGKGPQDPTIGYPEHDHHKKIGELTSAVRVVKLTVCKLHYSALVIFINLTIIKYLNMLVLCLLISINFMQKSMTVNFLM